ncbi:hypothetical protein PC9H_006203 [Pleurotus ostreatus]|uniref:HD domain-containing protein n=1 Tax=Pleurotus ostreatus TaxID=5322 RepID=A0A8H6ZW91_PLEOS|nr:uncharacterized protein PC9H_006203 [Pleurotus ostreatus]KAF7430495.1 hypothetical protein PC9H_006203 [Pleurotus ostreatus]
MNTAFSISDHMYRMAVLSMCTSDEKLDISKCVMMSIVHDLAEAQVGDITPREGFSKSEKNRLESATMHNFVHDMLHYSSAAKRIEALWLEYEEGRTAEAKFVKDLDRFEMACQGMRTYPCITDIWLKYQALEYERRNEEKDLQSFFDSSLPFIRHPEVQGWGKDLLNERNGGSSSGSKADSSQDTT